MTNPRPKVTIICITYNQEKYVRQAFDSFLMQDVGFPFDILVADDASTDSTPMIIKEYAKKYPGLFRPVLRDKNVGVAANFFMAFQEAKGEYIALCEGDDYWTAPHKLRAQIAYLDKHKDSALCFHTVRGFFEDEPNKDYLYPKGGDGTFTLKRLVKENFIQTNSVMYRKTKYKDMPQDILPVDWYLHLYHARFGKIGYLDEVMSAYRRHRQGVWWESQKDITKIWRKYGIGHLKLYQGMLGLFSDNKTYRSIIEGHINVMVDNIFDLKGADKVKRQVVVEFPEVTENYLSNLRKKYVETRSQMEYITPQLEQTKDEYNKLSQHTKNIQKQLELIQSSRVWKIRNKVTRLIGKDKPRER